MRVLPTLLHWGGQLRDRLLPGARILLYHRVSALQRDPQWLAVAPENFEQQLRLLARESNVVPLEQLRQLVLAGRIPRRTVAVTFDDGYADNLLEAAPLLMRSGLPATIFVSSDAGRAGRELYWDELERLLLHGDVLPARATLEVAGSVHQFDLGDGEPPASRAWNATQPAATGRQRSYLGLCALLRSLDDPARQAALEALRVQLGRPAGVRQENRMLDPDQLRRLAASAQIVIGAHAVTHPVLAQLSPGRQEEEIAGSRRELERLLGKPVTAFAYPYGGRGDFDATSRRLVREAGFTLACANISGVVRPGTDLFALPRVLVRDWPAAVFARQLAGWLGG